MNLLILRNSFIIVLLSLISTSCYNSKPSSNSESINEVKDLLENYYSIMSDKDWIKYQTFFIDDATLTTVWQAEGETTASIHANSISDFIAQTKDGPDSQRIFEENMISSDITLKQNIASAWVTYEAKFGTEEKIMEWKGNDLFSFIGHNGDWKITSLVFESIH